MDERMSERTTAAANRPAASLNNVSVFSLIIFPACVPQAVTLLNLYSQPKYVTCLDLGAWGALYTEGWIARCYSHV